MSIVQSNIYNYFYIKYLLWELNYKWTILSKLKRKLRPIYKIAIAWRFLTIPILDPHLNQTFCYMWIFSLFVSSMRGTLLYVLCTMIWSKQMRIMCLLFTYKLEFSNNSSIFVPIKNVLYRVLYKDEECWLSANIVKL